VIPALLIAFAACAPTQGSTPPRIDGTWEVADHALAGGCRWERATWTFGGETVAAKIDALCGDEAPEHTGCSVAAESPAGFDAATGRWQVERPVEVTAEAASVGGEHPLTPTSCSVTLPAGLYGFTKVRGEDWKWAMATPDGAQVRLRVPSSDHPDFVSALQSEPPEERPAPSATPGVSVWGRYRIAEVVTAGKTEDYRKKMDRAAKALQRGCTVTDTIYDLRSPSGAMPPTDLALTEVRTCDEGGLGAFRHTVTATVPVGWVDDESGALLVVPPVAAGAEIVRIHDEDGAGRPPSQWMSSELGVSRDETTFLVTVKAAKGKKPGPPAAVQLKAVDGTVFQLVPAS
jgi:hypothetical protein